MIEWEQPTLAQYARVVPAPVLEILFDLEKEPEEDPEEPALASSSKASDGGGPGWLLESGNESSHQFILEWMTDPYRKWRADWTSRPSLIEVHCSASASTPSERSATLEFDGAGPSGTVMIVISSNSSSEEDSDSSNSDTSSSEED